MVIYAASPVISVVDAVIVADVTATPTVVIAVNAIAVIASSAVVFAFNAGVVATVAPSVINGVVAVGELWSWLLCW